jgi:hypothetical protein
MVQARRVAGVAPASVRPAADTGWPQRWQNRAWGESSARQRVQARGERLAPQLLQNFPDAEAPQTGQVVAEGVVMTRRSVNGKR